MRLIDADALIMNLDDRYSLRDISREYRDTVVYELADAPTIVEFEGDINKVIVKGEEYHKQLATTWLGSYCPYRCEHCGHYTDSKTPYCAWCGRRATNYD